MSASAGKVMPRPMGEYNASTEYKILDIVTYNDRPYMAKQTTTGNLPTNTTYWMLLLDFPTLVDNAPTQNSQNLVYSGGVYSALENKMDADGGNVVNFLVDYMPNTYGTIGAASSITKEAGESQPVTIVVYVSGTDRAERVLEMWKARVGDDSINYSIDSNRTYLVIDSVAESSGTITMTAHLKTDNTAAISITDSTILYGGTYVGQYNDENIVAGAAHAILANNVLTSGSRNSANNDNTFAVGMGNVVSGARSVAEGEYNLAKGSNSHASGQYLVAGYNHQFVCGKYNNNKSGTLFEVGKGMNNSHGNAFEVYSDGTFSQNDGTDKYKFAKSGGIDGFYDGSNNFHPFYKELVNNSVTLSTSADTTVTFTDTAITANSTIEPFTSVYGINPSNVVATSGSCTVTIPKQSTAQTIKVKIRVS